MKSMNAEDFKDKRIAVLLSGGVDSSVVVYELARLGLHPDCFYIKIGPESGNVPVRKNWRWRRLWPTAMAVGLRLSIVTRNTGSR